MSDSVKKNVPESEQNINCGSEYRECKCPHGQYRSAMVFSWACVVLAFMSQIVCGIISAVLDFGVLYVCIHFLCAVLVYGALGALILKMTMSGKKMLCSVYDFIMTKIPFRTLLAILVSVAGIVAQCLFAFVFDKDQNVWAIVLCIVLHLFSIFAAFGARLSVTGLPFRKSSDN